MHIDQMANENPTLETNFAATPAMAHKIIFMDNTEAVINKDNQISKKEIFHTDLNQFIIAYHQKLTHNNLE